MNTYIKPSKIHGLGLFAIDNIKKGQVIIHGSPNYSDFWDEWTVYNKSNVGKSYQFIHGLCMVNHADPPNTKRNEMYEIVATKDINKNEEITEDYNLLLEHDNPFNENSLGKFLENVLMQKYK